MSARTARNQTRGRRADRTGRQKDPQHDVRYGACVQTRPEGIKIERQAPEFTIRQNNGRGGGNGSFRGGGGGDMRARGGGRPGGGGSNNGQRFGRGPQRGGGRGGGPNQGFGRGPGGGQQ